MNPAQSNVLCMADLETPPPPSPLIPCSLPHPGVVPGLTMMWLRGR